MVVDGFIYSSVIVEHWFGMKKKVRGVTTDKYVYIYIYHKGRGMLTHDMVRCEIMISNYQYSLLICTYVRELVK